MMRRGWREDGCLSGEDCEDGEDGKDGEGRDINQRGERTG